MANVSRERASRALTVLSERSAHLHEELNRFANVIKPSEAESETYPDCSLLDKYVEQKGCDAVHPMINVFFVQISSHLELYRGHLQWLEDVGPGSQKSSQAKGCAFDDNDYA